MDPYLQHEGRKRGENGVQVWIEEQLAEKHKVKNKEKCGKKFFLNF